MFKLFTAAWCNPCSNLKQWLDEKGWLEDNGIEVLDVDSEDGGKEAMKVGVRGLPALLTPEGLITTNEKIRPYLEKHFNE